LARLCTGETQPANKLMLRELGAIAFAGSINSEWRQSSDNQITTCAKPEADSWIQYTKSQVSKRAKRLLARVCQRNISGTWEYRATSGVLHTAGTKI